MVAEPTECHAHDHARRQSGRPRLCYVVTHARSTRFLRGQLGYMRASGYDVTLITSPGTELDELRRVEQVNLVAVPMERDIHLLRDIGSLLRLYLAFRRLGPHIVNAGTPKAGLLGMLAARLARVPVRIYTLHGLRLETAAGWKRAVLAGTERLAAWCASRIICVSRSLQESYSRHRLAPRSKLCVLGSGTCNGLDLPTTAAQTETTAPHVVRTEIGIPVDVPVLGFVGRMTRDKGIVDLLLAFKRVQKQYPGVCLLLVGDYERGDPLPAACRRQIRDDANIYHTGFVDQVARYYNAMDVLVHASYREGFPYAPLEAAAAAVPVVGYRVTGVTDAVCHGVTGWLVRPGDLTELAEAIGRYLARPALRRAHGAAGRARVVREFAQQIIWQRLRAEYSRLLGSQRRAALALEDTPAGATVQPGGAGPANTQQPQAGHAAT